MYIIKDANNRYFVKWFESTPIFNGDIYSAKVLNENDVDKTIRSLRMIVKGNYEKMLCNDETIKKMNRDNPEWYRQQIEELINKYNKQSENFYDDGECSRCQEIIDDLEKIL